MMRVADVSRRRILRTIYASGEPRKITLRGVEYGYEDSLGQIDIGRERVKAV
jgi:hypothetical protein